MRCAGYANRMPCRHGDFFLDKAGLPHTRCACSSQRRKKDRGFYCVSAMACFFAVPGPSVVTPDKATRSNAVTPDKCGAPDPGSMPLAEPWSMRYIKSAILRALFIFPDVGKALL